MDREKVIKGQECCQISMSEENPFEKCEECPYNHIGISVQDCRSVLSGNTLELLKEQEWNLLTEDDEGIIHGLPGDDGQYLMTDGRYIWIDDYMDGVDDGIFLDSGRDVREIKAWMYMPKLPEEGR